MTISVGQQFAVLAKLGENIDWDSLTTEQVQVGIRESARAGVEATAFIRNGFRIQVGDFFRETGEVAIQIPALPRPTLAELQAKFSWIKEIEPDTSPECAVTLALGTLLRSNEERISGSEYQQRRVPLVSRMFGYQHAERLIEHQYEFPGLMALLGKVYIDFPGLVVVDADGRRYFPCLDGHGRRWYLLWRWTGRDLDRNGRLAVSGK